jgi:hypothetical protein
MVGQFCYTVHKAVARNPGERIMFESVGRSGNSNLLSIGRIAFCVFTALPIIILLRLLLDPGQTKEERLGDFLQGIIMYLLSLILTFVGGMILIRAKIKRLPVLFWSIALLFAALPILVALAAAFIAEL